MQACHSLCMEQESASEYWQRNRNVRRSAFCGEVRRLTNRERDPPTFRFHLHARVGLLAAEAVDGHDVEVRVRNVLDREPLNAEVPRDVDSRVEGDFPLDARTAADPSDPDDVARRVLD